MAGLVSGEGLLFGADSCLLTVNSHNLFVHAGRESVFANSVVSLLLMTLILSDQGVVTSFSLNYTS